MGSGVPVKEKMMVCPECTGTTFVEGAYNIAQMFRDRPIMVRNVPAKRCEQCGYLIITAETAGQIERVLTRQAVVDVIATDVYDLATPRGKSNAIVGRSA